MSFSPQKFSSFTPEKRHKKLFDLLQKIEKQWNDTTSRTKLVAEFSSLAPLAGKDFSQVSFASQKKFLLSVAKLENLHQIYKRDWEILSKDEQKSDSTNPKLPLVLILDNLRSAFNVGAILRTAECFHIQRVIFCGVTPDLGNHKVKKTSMGCWQHLECQKCQTTLQAIGECRKAGYKVLALETTTNSLPLASIEFDQPTALVMGNEALGIQPQTLQLCDGVYQIELQGWKNSLNVGICCGIALYELSQKK